MERHQAEPDVLVAAFADPLEATECLQELRTAGFAENEIGVVAPDNLALDREEIAEHSRVAEGSVVGAVAGASLGGLWCAAMAVELMPVIGIFVAGGLLGSAVVTAATGAALGGLAGALVGLGVPEEKATHFQQKLHDGHVVITVRPREHKGRALTILERHHGSLQPA